ncbi:MAG TPA: DUF1697 domain-containing protein [Anaerolineae bacterium]|nr:DUF1697 domain-containing protein [Anaerolineae bacterium]HMR66947.1 DUF1697 domain-containing protein [Anaerolineae bacterium]
MKTYIGLLRGINVGGANRLSMRQLVEVLQDLGLKNVKTYIQSGNVVFQSEPIKAVELSDRISAAIKQSHGFAPQVLLLELDELEQAAATNPFPQAEAEPKTLHLYFLAAVPQNPDLETLEDLKQEREQFSLQDKVFYLFAPDGIGRSKLAERAEKALGVAATARNWRSVCKIMEMAKQLG